MINTFRVLARDYDTSCGRGFEGNPRADVTRISLFSDRPGSIVCLEAFSTNDHLPASCSVNLELSGPHEGHVRRLEPSNVMCSFGSLERQSSFRSPSAVAWEVTYRLQDGSAVLCFPFCVNGALRMWQACFSIRKSATLLFCRASSCNSTARKSNKMSRRLDARLQSYSLLLRNRQITSSNTVCFKHSKPAPRLRSQTSGCADCLCDHSHFLVPSCSTMNSWIQIPVDTSTPIAVNQHARYKQIGS